MAMLTYLYFVISLVHHITNKHGLLVLSFSPAITNRPFESNCLGRRAIKTCLSASRRTFIETSAFLVMAGAFSAGSAIAADDNIDNIPLVTAPEFYSIANDSANSIAVVEFSGPKSETIRVKLLDGTIFGIKGIVESSTDPRSPFKIAAVCRENKIPTKFKDLELALQNSGGKKKANYANSRVQEAAIKNQEKAKRMQQDEENRLAELARQQS